LSYEASVKGEHERLCLLLAGAFLFEAAGRREIPVTAARRPAPRRRLNPFLLREVARSNINKNVIARDAGWPHYVQFYLALRSETIVATEKTTKRLMRVADLVGFRRDQVFLDEPAMAEAAR
jgi:hypothetical protein